MLCPNLGQPSGRTEGYQSAGFGHRRAQTPKNGVEMSTGEWWIAFGVLGGLLPTYLFVRTVLHVLNIPVGRK